MQAFSNNTELDVAWFPNKKKYLLPKQIKRYSKVKKHISTRLELLANVWQLSSDDTNLIQRTHSASFKISQKNKIAFLNLQGATLL